MLSATTPSQINWHAVIGTVISETNNTAIQQCSHIIDVIRRSETKHRNTNIEALCVYLEKNPSDAKKLGSAVCEIVTQSDVTFLLTESGVPSNKGFASELIYRFEQRFLPELDDPDDLRTSLRILFNHHDALLVGERRAGHVVDPSHDGPVYWRRPANYHQRSVGYESPSAEPSYCEPWTPTRNHTPVATPG